MTSARFQPPDRLLLGPGPSPVHPRVLAALGLPLVGHLDPAFLAMMDDCKALLRQLFQTVNELTFAVSGTGSAGMEACLVNLLEEGDEAVVVVNGEFGRRMVDIVERCGARPVVVDLPWGTAVSPEDVVAALDRCSRPRLVAVVHAETSTGAWSPIEEIGPFVRDRDALFVVDAVTSLGGCPVKVDEWAIDACYSGTQKCLSCPPGLAPVTFGPRAVERLRARRTKVRSWYLDLTMIEKYWGPERLYHHTAPISMAYALTEALHLVLEEGLEARFRRHRRNHVRLVAGLEALGFGFFVEPLRRLWMLNSVVIPDGLDEVALRKRLLVDYGIEIGGGIGALRGRILRIGLMGEGSRRDNVLALIAALEDLLPSFGMRVRHGAGLAAAAAADVAE